MALLPQQTIPTDHPAKSHVLAQVGADDWLIVGRRGELDPRQCYQNVYRLVTQRGGEVVLGWMVDLVPGVYIELMHHAIWRTPGGELLDVTAPQDGERDKNGPIVFIPDDSVQINFDRPIPTNNKYVTLIKDPDLREYLRMYRVSIESWRRLGALPQGSDEFLKVARKHNKARSAGVQLGKRLRRRYFLDEAGLGSPL